MKRSIILTALAAFVLAIPVTAFAGVSGTKHDLTVPFTGDGTIGTSQLCYACHIPHNANGTTLWARATGSTFTGVHELCYSCHDGTLVALGSDTVMDTGLEQHKTVGSDCSGDGACHDVHSDQPKFLSVTNPGVSCEACHAADPGAPFTNNYLNHQVAVSNHPLTGGMTCLSCHMVHGAFTQSDMAEFDNTTPAMSVDPILRDDNTSGGYYGAMCVECHSGTGTDHTGAAWNFPANTYDYAEAVIDGSALKHPTIATTTGSANWAGAAFDGCDNCHDPHNEASGNEWILITDNTDGAGCVGCHNGSTGPGTAGGGQSSHYIGVPTDPNDYTINSAATPALPWANQQDDSPKAGLDYASGTTNYMTCQSCHSVHRAGADEYFLRQTNGQSNTICSGCHTAN